MALRDQERRYQATDAHREKALFPLAYSLELFLQATEASCGVKGQNSMLDLDGTMGKISRVIVTAWGEIEQNINLFVLPFSSHMYFAFLIKIDLFFNCLLFVY